MQLANVDQPLTMSSREIAEIVNSRHDNVKRTMETLENKALITFTQSEEKGNGRPAIVYHVNKRNSYIVVAQLSPEFTAALVDRWQELENAQKPALPQTFSEALQLAADQARQLELQAPKVEFHDTVVQTDQTYKYQEAGKKLQQRPNKFVAWLRENNYITSQNVPYQRYIDQGLFKMNSGVKNDHAYTQGRVTGKGLAYFTNKLGDINL